ncbi:inositol monophosphatase family protein [Parvularcula lutaonensis]|uniref:Inositol monophosphatase family protein n=1 Tax=Parvularcula lutaonensis TaxID=491923 RepID=A0ABV7MBG7_9PROT|nr:inositol monophosphatase family protein [Parvularcula lutaonensis]
MDIRTLTDFAADLARAAAQETLPRFRAGIDIVNKAQGGFDPVTEGDREAERALRTLISDRFPGHGIKGEEFPEKEGTEPWRWVLDPIDGTRAFICGVPMWTTLIGLEHEGRPVFGIIDQPHLKERWVGETLSNAKSLLVTGPAGSRVSGCASLSEARMMATDMRAGEYFSDDEAEAVLRLGREVRVTRQGLDSYGFALVASGQMDMVVEAGLHWHDVAAVIPVIEAAGGTITDWQGAELRDTGGTLQVIVAASPKLAEDAARILRA